MKTKKYINIKIGPFTILTIIKNSQSLVSQEFCSRLNTYLSGFIINDALLEPDFTIEIVEKPISKIEYLTRKQNNRIKVYIKNFVLVNHKKIITYNGISIYAFNFILKRVIDLLLYKRGFFFFHTSACLYKNKAYLFLGKNGAGKSTIIKLLSPIAKPLADDSGIIAKEKNKYYFYQTPLMCNNPIKGSFKKYILGKIFFIYKSKSFSIKHFSLPKNRNSLIKLFKSVVLLNKIDNNSLLSFINKFQENLYRLFFSLQERELIKNSRKIFD